MKFSFVGKSNVVSDAIKELTMEKMDRLSKFLPEGTDLTIAYKVTKLENKVEVTFNAFKRSLRAEAKADDMYVAIDQVTEVMEKQLRRLKTRLQDKQRKGRGEEGINLDIEEAVSDFEPSTIITRKKFLVEDMEIEDAITAMELSGHNFYLFRNPETSEVNVIYKTREDDRYGLIEPK